jgi:hypothetical protein
MMDSLEEKAGIFVKTINMLQGEAEKSVEQILICLVVAKVILTLKLLVF